MMKMCFLIFLKFTLFRFYGGGHSREERESVRRKEREDRDNMVRDFIR